MDATTRKKHVQWNILQNPTEITIHATQRVKANGGFEEVQSQIGPLMVRLFATSRQPKADVVSERAGRKETSDSYSLLADHMAGLPSGSDITQEFDTPLYGKFQIMSVHPQITHNEICGYIAELERVK